MGKFVFVYSYVIAYSRRQVYFVTGNPSANNVCCYMYTYFLFSGKMNLFSAPLITCIVFGSMILCHACALLCAPYCSDKSLLESPLLHTLLSVLGEPANLSSWWKNPSNTCYQTVGLVHQLCLVMVDWLPWLLEKTDSPGESVYRRSTCMYMYATIKKKLKYTLIGW